MSNSKTKSVGIILPNQLFEKSPILTNCQNQIIYLIEDSVFFTKFPFHKQKLVFHRSSMKSYEIFLSNLYPTINIKYIDVEKCKITYEDIFANYDQITIYDPIDKTIQTKFENLAKKYNKIINVLPNLLFIETKTDLDTYYKSLKSHVRYVHDMSFYRWQRIRLNIFIDDNKNPLYGQWSFDKLNRNKFSSIYVEPKLPNMFDFFDKQILISSIDYVELNWPNNFGQIPDLESTDWIWPIGHKLIKTLFRHFLKYKLATFGTYQDGVSTNIQFGSHSLLSAGLNIGLITPQYILKHTIKAFNKLSINNQKQIYPNVEAFIRQIIGWRSYVRFMYEYHGNQMLNSNLFDQTLNLTDHWFNAQTGIYPIDFLIKKVEKYAYAHHIERLMYLSNFALILGIKPLEIYKWFMICFIDSYEWVMIPNVMGMGQYSSNIKMMSKPYFSSSNYIKLMSDFKINTYNKIQLSNKLYYWNEIFDALYYEFINKNSKILKGIYSVSRNVAHWNKKTSVEKNKLIVIANLYKKSLYRN